MKIVSMAGAIAAAAMLAGCAAQQRAPSPLDPIEPVNRAVFEFNETADRFVFKPVAQGYKFVLPEVVRTGVTNFFANLADPWIAVNQLLQGKVELALSDGWRFITNSTLGLGGIFDIATDMGLPKHNEDFGQTLGVWGFDTGAFLVLPILGPSSVRDGIGLIADTYGFLPWRLPDWLDFNHRVAWQNSLSALDFVNIRANLLDATDLLEDAALDRYAFIRDAYFQRRRNLVYDGNPPPKSAPTSGLAPAPDLDTELAREPAPLHPDSATDAAAELAPFGATSLAEPRVPDNYPSVLAADGMRAAATR
jgi:phospholipid-binding lipoprotein MlaA